MTIRTHIIEYAKKHEAFTAGEVAIARKLNVNSVRQELYRMVGDNELQIVGKRERKTTFGHHRPDEKPSFWRRLFGRK